MVYGICSASWVQDIGRQHSLGQDCSVVWLSLMLELLLIVALIKCCMRQIECIWSQPLVRLIRVADGVVYLEENFPEANTV